MMLELPKIAVDILNDLGYSELYPTQELAIKEGVLNGESMIISTPTASGKTLIALLTSAIHVNNKKKVIYMTPLKALANEKFEEFRLLEKYNAKVMISTGDLDSSSNYLKDADIIILTNEKFDSLMRHSADWLDSVGLFIVDEIHMVGDRYRGATLEIVLSKILTYYNNAQLLALSATITNIDDIASWLRSKIVNMNWRPVKLVEGVFSYGEIIFNDNTLKKIKQSGRDSSIDLALDCISQNGQALIFTESRRRAVTLALKASEVMSKILNKDDIQKAKGVARAITENDDTELAQDLAYAVSNCVAFHHAGLSYICRKIVEHYYKEGLIKLITATPTLASGVNLPARRVIISSIKRFDIENGIQEISVMDYKQMCGRAGRPKYDTYGEAIIINNMQELIMSKYINARPEPIRSSLLDDDNMKMHLLGIIASMPGINEEELLVLLSNTLMAKHYRINTIKHKVDNILDYLLINELITIKGDKVNRFLATELGKLASILYLHPATAISFKDTLQLYDNITIIGLLQVITRAYDFTPKIPLRNKDKEELELLDDEMLIEEECNRSLLGLYAWINEHSERFILERLDIEPGDLYRIIESADWLLYSFSQFAKSINKLDILSEINRLDARIKYGVKEELLGLVSIKDIGRVRARILYNAGFKTKEDLKNASINRLASLPKIGDTLAKKIKSNIVVGSDI